MSSVFQAVLDPLFDRFPVIAIGGKRHRLGRFNDEIAAAQRYDEAARELFGEHARLNFPDGIDAALSREAA